MSKLPRCNKHEPGSEKTTDDSCGDETAPSIVFRAPHRCTTHFSHRSGVRSGQGRHPLARPAVRDVTHRGYNLPSPGSTLLSTPEYGNAPPHLGVTSVTPNPVACFIVDCVLGVYFSTAPDIHLLVYFEDLTDSFRCFTRGVGLVRIHLKNKLNGSLNMEFEIIIQSLANIPRT